MENNRLEVINVSKKYKKRDYKAIDNISLSFENHGLVLIKGKSGSGKTTLLQMLAGNSNPTSGKILFNGHNIYGKFNDKYHGSIETIVFQDLNLIEELSIYDNLALLPCLNKEKDKREIITEALSQLSLPDDDIQVEEFLRCYPNQLSQGQQQRVAIARALLSKPEILLLDEPSSSLDEENKGNLFEIIKKYSKNNLVIIVSHDSSFPNEYADRILTLSIGKLTDDINRSNQMSSNPTESKPYSNAFLSFKNSLKMSLVSLRFKKIFLAVSILLSVICLTSLGLALTFTQTDVNEVALRSQKNDQNRETFIMAEERLADHSSTGYSDYHRDFSEQEISILDEWSGNRLFYVAKDFEIDLGANFRPAENTLYTYLKGGTIRGIEVDSEDDMNYLGLVPDDRLTSPSRLPKDYTEIAITDLEADVFLKSGYIVVDQDDMVTPVFNSIDDILGIKIAGLTVTGIYKTKDDYSMWETMDYDTYEKNSNLYYPSMSSSLSKSMFVKKGFNKRNSPDNNYQGVFMLTTGDIYKDIRYLRNFGKKDNFGNYISVLNKYSGYSSIVSSFQDDLILQLIIYSILILLLVFSFLLSLSFFHSNVKNMGHNLSILRSIGISKMSAFLIVLIQAVVLSLVFFCLSILALGIISLITNHILSFSLLTIYPSVFFIMLGIILLEAVFLSLLSTSKVLSTKNTANEIKKQR